MRWPAPAALALALIVISPMLFSGWLADDAFYSALPGVLGADRITLWQAIAHSFHIWFFGNGRFYPGLIVEKYIVFDVFTNLVAYKIFLAAATLAALEMFRRCVLAYTTPAFAALCALCAAALFIIHGYQDAIVAFNAMPQAVAIALLGSFIAFRTALVQPSRAAMTFSFALYMVAVLTYEDAYLLCAIYPFLARSFTRDWRTALRAAAPFALLAAALALFELILRAWAKVPPGALYAVNADPFAFLRTVFYQVTAALPFAYWLADPLRSFPAIALAVFAAFLVVSWFGLPASGDPVPKRLPLVTGVLSAILPGIPVALLVKYQHELRPGIGHLPVFLQTFGLALLLASALTAAARSRFRTAARIAGALTLGLLAAGAYASNAQLVRAQEPAQAARAVFERDLASGLLSKVPDGSTITIPRLFDWIDYDDSGPDGISSRGLLYRFAARRADLEAPGDLRAGYALSYSSASQIWALSRIASVHPPIAPAPCNTAQIVNGDFTFGFRCWAQVAVVGGRFTGFPQFRLESAGTCLPAAKSGNPYAAVDVPGGAAAYIAQTFRYRRTPTRVTLRAWSVAERVTVEVGIVYPVGIGIGSERILDRFVAPALQLGSGACSGLRPFTKTYAFSGYARDALIQLRLHATSVGSNGAIAAFDGVTSWP